MNGVTGLVRGRAAMMTPVQNCRRRTFLGLAKEVVYQAARPSMGGQTSTGTVIPEQKLSPSVGVNSTQTGPPRRSVLIPVKNVLFGVEVYGLAVQNLIQNGNFSSLAVVCSSNEVKVVDDGLKQSVTDKLEDWSSQVIAKNYDAIAAHYADNGILSPTVSAEIRQTEERRRAYFVENFAPHVKGAKWDWDNAIWSDLGDYVMVAGDYTFTKNDDSVVHAQFTYTIEKATMKIKLHTSRARPE